MNIDHRFLSATIIFLLISSSVIVVSSKESSNMMIFNYSFFEPDVFIVNDGVEQYLQVTYLDFPFTGSPLLPLIPFKPITIMLPKGTVEYVVSVETGDEHVVLFPEHIPIRCNGAVRTYSDKDFFVPSVSLPPVFPERVVDVLDIQYKHGVGLLTILLYPFSYSSASHTLKRYESITVSIDVTQYDDENYPIIHESKIAATNWKEIVDNPGIVNTYHFYDSIGSTVDDAPEYDYVLITTEALLNSSGDEYNFYDLLDAREAFGLSTFVKTVEDITIEYDGVDTQEKIRNFIKDMYYNHNTTYVLLGGDTSHVPIRMLYGGNSWSTDDFVSSDLYYQCLIGDYNYNGNDKWGEINDGVDGGYIDLHAEVYLGRSPAFDASEVSHFVEKTLSYEQSDLLDDAYLQRVLSVGEKVWSGMGGWGSGYVELCIDHRNVYNQVTDGIPSHRYTIVELYERDRGWDTQEFIAEINNGVNIINHLSHGSVVSLGKVRISDIYQLENEGRYGLFYSQACKSGQIQSYNCIASHWVNSEKKGGFAAIMNSGDGFGSTIDYDGADNRFAREFYHALFSPSQQISRIGIAHMRSKEANYYRINEPNMMYVYYNKLLLGCPYVEIKGSENTNALFSFEPGYPRTGSSVSFTDESTGWLKYWEWQFGDGHRSYQRHPSHVFTTEGVYTVRLRVWDSVGYQSTITKQITVQDQWPPVAVITPSFHQGKDLTVAFSAEESFDPDGVIVSYSWDFDDGEISTEKNPVHTFPGFGTYQVRLFVTDDEGLTGNSVSVVVLEENLPPLPPKRPAGMATLGLGNESLYYTQMNNSKKDFIQYQWEFGGDGLSNWSKFFDPDEIVSKSHRWQTGGQQFVRVKARDQYGLESAWSEKLMVIVIDEVPPTISLIRPGNAVYLRDTRLFSFQKPILIGRTMISVDVMDEGGVAKVVFHVDGRPVAEVNNAPFEWRWRFPVFLPQTVLIQVQAFDVAGNQAWASVEVFKIL